MADFPFKVPPMEHQLDALRGAFPKREFALFHEMGLGKTYVAINLAAARYQKDLITSVLVICPNSIKPVWDTEIEKFNPELDLEFKIIGVESLSQGGGFERTKQWMAVRKVMVVVDESSRIKNFKARRTQRVIHLGGLAQFRIIMTGTPITQGIHDLFAQFTFLNSKILGCLSRVKKQPSFLIFRNKYCIMGGFQGRKIEGYQNTNDLMDKVAPYIHTAYIKDCLNLPEKVYEKVVVQATPEQKRALKDLKEVMGTTQGDKTLEVSMILERMTRCQQIIGGTFPYKEDEAFKTEPIAGKNPKLEALMELIEDQANDKKFIIWARFRPELEYIRGALAQSCGEESVAEFHGGIDEQTRADNIRRFQEDSRCRFWVSNQATGGFGLTLTAASCVVYFSNSFSYEDRVQSEARAHRKGQTKTVVYVDLEMNVHEDRMILRAIDKKQDLAKLVQDELENRKVA